jgi:hypothetical protein
MALFNPVWYCLMFSADPFAFGQQILNPTLRSLSLSLLKVHGSTFGQRWERLPILLFQLAAVFAESLIGYSSVMCICLNILPCTFQQVGTEATPSGCCLSNDLSFVLTQFVNNGIFIFILIMETVYSLIWVNIL